MTGMEQRPSNLSGAVTSYTHSNGKIGVLVEVTCNSDFAARSDEFKELMHELALQIAAASPKFIRKEDIPGNAGEGMYVDGQSPSRTFARNGVACLAGAGVELRPCQTILHNAGGARNRFLKPSTD